MELLNYLSPFDELPITLSLHKINKNVFGEDVVQLRAKSKIYDYLISPLSAHFFKVNTDDYNSSNLYYGEIVVVERSNLKIDGLAVVKIDNRLEIREIAHDKNFNTILKKTPNEAFDFFGTITYVLKSEEVEYMEMLTEDMFRVG